MLERRFMIDAILPQIAEEEEEEDENRYARPI